MEKSLKDKSSIRKLSIFGSYNKNSLGDKVILVSLLNLLFLESKSDLYIYIISFEKQAILDEIKQYEWSNRIGVISLSTRKSTLDIHSINNNLYKRIFSNLPSIFKNFLRAIWYSLIIFRSNLLFDSSGLIIGGGNLLMDLYPSWPSRVYLLSRKFSNAGLPVTFAGVGAFPIKTRIGEFFLKESVRKAALVYVRDQQTKDLIVRKWKISAQYHPDFAFSFPINNENDSEKKKETSIAINFAPVYSKWWPYQDDKKYKDFLNAISRCLYECFANTNPKPSFWFYDTNLSDQVGTEELINNLIGLGVLEENIKYERRDFTSNEIAKILSKMQYAIVTRLHAGLLALRVETPIIAIVYQPKVKDVLNSIGLRKGVVDIQEVSKIHSLIEEVNVDNREFRLSHEQLNMLDCFNKEVINDILKTIFNNDIEEIFT
jgi:polysaccharide pyruvyl transferase WcaK-like protein